MINSFFLRNTRSNKYKELDRLISYPNRPTLLAVNGNYTNLERQINFYDPNSNMERSSQGGRLILNV